MASTIIYTGNNYTEFSKSVYKASGMYINCACTSQDDHTTMYFWIGKEYHPKHKQKEIYLTIDKGSFLMFPPKHLIK